MDDEEFEKLGEDKVDKIEHILEMGSEIDLWDIELPEKEKKNKQGEQRGGKIDFEDVDFSLSGILKDFVDLENEANKINNKGAVEIFIDTLKKLQEIGVDVTKIVEKSNTDVIRAMFPGGTITGAPKIRTMEIIEELEPVRRGLYTGSIGWIGYTGDLELNIVIRTAYVQDEMAYIQAGAGIVIDSIPENEYIESMNKAKAMWQAKAMAEGVGKFVAEANELSTGNILEGLIED